MSSIHPEETKKLYQIFAVDDDINAVHRSPMPNNADIPKLSSHLTPNPSRVVGSPSRTLKSLDSRLGTKPARSLIASSSKTTPIRVVRTSPKSSKKSPNNGINQLPSLFSLDYQKAPLSGSNATPLNYLTPSSINSTTPSRLPSSATKPLFSRERPQPLRQRRSQEEMAMNAWQQNNNIDSLLEHLSLTMPSASDYSHFEHSMLSRDRYLAKNNRLNDTHNERLDCHLICDIVDKELNCDEICEKLHSSDTNDVLDFLKSNTGSRYIRDLMQSNVDFCKDIARLIIDKNMVETLSTSAFGNFILQLIPGEDQTIDKLLCDQLIENLPKLCVHKYGCRVVQSVIEHMHSELVRNLIAALKGHEQLICIDKSGIHVAQRLLEKHRYNVCEPFFQPLTNDGLLHVLMTDKYGCRVIQNCLESWIKDITPNFVPPLLNEFVVQLLRDTHIYMKNESANYVIQFIIKCPEFRRQRDYIIDSFLLGKLLHLSQGKFSSHVVEEALNSACPDRVARMCNEIFYDYRIKKGPTPLEIMLFDNYANYVVQKLTQIAIHTAIREGDPTWFNLVLATVMRNEQRLMRYSSGKKILDMVKIF